MQVKLAYIRKMIQLAREPHEITTGERLDGKVYIRVRQEEEVNFGDVG